MRIPTKKGDTKKLVTAWDNWHRLESDTMLRSVTEISSEKYIIILTESAISVKFFYFLVKFPSIY